MFRSDSPIEIDAGTLIHSDAPGFSSLLWDNVKTTAVFGGCIAGIAPAAAGGLVTLAVGCPEAGFAIGYGVGFAVLGPISAAIFALPFTFAAQHRKFMANNDIELNANWITTQDDQEIQQYIINQIIKRDSELSWGIRSYESYNLMFILNSNYSLEIKWKVLTAYLNEKTYFDNNAYVNNGKKLFNAILELTPQIQLWESIKKDAVKIEDTRTTPQSITLLMTFPELLSQVDSNGMTPLHMAASCGNTNVINYLIQNGADLNLPAHMLSNEYHGKTALDLAVQFGHQDAVKQLLDVKATSSKPEPYLLQTAIENDHLETVRVLFRNPTAHKQKNSQGQTLLHIAAANNKKNIAEFFCNSHRIDLNSKDSKSKTAVQIADENGHVEVAEYLVAQGADDAMYQLKSELSILFKIIQNPNWKQEGSGFFVCLGQTHTPDHIKNLRKLFVSHTVSSDDFATMTRTKVQALANMLKNYNFGSNCTRGKNSATLYTLINNLGNNTISDLNKLSAFSVPAITVQRISETNFNRFTQ